MRYATIGALLALILVGQMGLSQDKVEKKLDDSEIKTEFPFLQKNWGLKVKRVELVPVAEKEKFAIKVSFEFEKDLEAKELKELVSEIFVPGAIPGGKPAPLPEPSPRRIFCHLFDGDNVEINRSALVVSTIRVTKANPLEGAISGVKGDVFRLTINDGSSAASFLTINTEQKAKLKKIAFRQGPQRE